MSPPCTADRLLQPRCRSSSSWDPCPPHQVPPLRNDTFALTPVALSPDATVCAAPDATLHGGHTAVTVDTAGGAWLPSGTYTGELRVGAFPAELALVIDTTLPEAYRAAAKSVLEAKVGRTLTDEEVPTTVTLEAYAWLDDAAVTLYYRGEDVAPLLTAAPTDDDIRSAYTPLVYAQNVDAGPVDQGE